MKRQVTQIDKFNFFSNDGVFFNIADITALLKQPRQCVIHLHGVVIKMEFKSDKERNVMFDMLRRAVISHKEASVECHEKHIEQNSALIANQEKALKAMKE